MTEIKGCVDNNKDMKNILPNKKSSGFTLIELLVALTIVAILAVSVYVALNPAQRLKDAKDSRRATDVDTILTAVHQYIVDNKGNATGLGLSATEEQLGTAATGCAISNTNCTVTAAACKNLSTPLATYLKSVPFDPDTTLGSAAETGYSIAQDANGIVTVKACYTDGSTTISASR